ncbi:MAG: YybH family protein [Caulobacteraceae bacterium]
MRAAVFAFLVLFFAQPAFAAPASPKDEAAIRAVVADMETAWNQGDFTGYMQGFENPGVTFVSKGRILTGWQETLDHYIRDYGGSPDKRGTLHFEILSIEMLGPDAAQLISHYQLVKPNDPQDGINTRLFRKVNGRWVIALNHVSSKEPPAPADPAPEIRAVMDAQVAAWNRGDIDGFMAGYWNSPDLTFVSGTTVTKGWAETLARYKRRYDSPAAMGRLAFSDITVTPLGPDAALAIGRWELTRDKDKPSGVFTLTWRRIGGAWKIVVDHTS